MSQSATAIRRFWAPAAPAALAGAVWDGVGLPLGWLMGAALVTGVVAGVGVDVAVPKLLNAAALVVIGASVGLALTPSSAIEMAHWAPAMLLAAALGVALSVAAAPLLARAARLDQATAFFALLPGGVIEMASIAARHGGDRTVIAALHAVRVGLVVSLTPLALFTWYDGALTPPDAAAAPWLDWAVACALAGLGGWAASRLGVPAGWLLGAVIAAGAYSMLGFVAGASPAIPLIVAQVVVGMALGARFRRESFAAVPRAALVATILLVGVMALMAFAGGLTSLAGSEQIATLVLCFGVGGMAEMVLTAKALGQNAALVAAFQAVRAVFVNLFAAAIWSLLKARRSRPKP